MIQRPTPDRPRVSKLEWAGRVAVGAGVAALVGVVGNLTWEGAGGQYIPMGDMFRDSVIALAGTGSAFVGFGMMAVGRDIR